MSILRSFERWFNESAYRAGVRADQDGWNAREKAAAENARLIAEGKMEPFNFNLYVPRASEFMQP